MIINSYHSIIILLKVIKKFLVYLLLALQSISVMVFPRPHSLPDPPYLPTSLPTQLLVLSLLLSNPPHLLAIQPPQKKF